jgi:1-acyl-sn-glycerol-3-phosphate acyltransferase
MRIVPAMILAVLFLLFGYILLGFFWIVRKFAPYKADLCQLRIVQFIFKCIAWICGTRLTVLGEENVPKDEAVLYVANHRSMLDIVLTYSRCPDLTGYIAKNAVEKVPALRVWMRRLHCLFIDRDDMKQSMKVILTAIDHIKNGISIFIFPEGTRNREQEDSANVLTFKDGSFKIAQKTGCKIVPVAITGTAEIFENHFPWVKPSKVVIEYGKPVTYKDLDPADQKHVAAYFQNEIHQMLESHKKL